MKTTNIQYFRLIYGYSVKDYTISDGQNKTGNNDRFLRFLWEVSSKDFHKDHYIFYAKGGEFRKWYGNLYQFIDWSPTTRLHYRKDKICRIIPEYLWFKKGITWTFITSGSPSFRTLEENSTFDVGGTSIFLKDDKEQLILLALLNSKISTQLIKQLNPTLNLQLKDVQSIPVHQLIFKDKSLRELVATNVLNSKSEWNSRETSWDFQQNELIRLKGQDTSTSLSIDLEESYDLYQQYWKNKFFQLHKNEEELNRQFIEIYGLQEELTPDVPLEDITILKDETTIVNNQLVFKKEEIFAQFISYAVGCMFGRYSLDKEGLILANQGETLVDYLAKIGKEDSGFLPDEDNIIPILDDEWFEDDIVGRFHHFLKASFGKENFDKNLAFVEECLGKDIRKYFVKDFYNDHIKRYKKRPIYWMFSSPKGSFNVLIYMHRYTQDTLNKILNDYLIQYREKLNTRIEHLEHIKDTGSSTEQIRAEKEINRLKLIIMELMDYERDILRPLAIDRIGLDLDYGVLVNYNKFGKAIKEVAGLNDTKTKKKVKKFDWIKTEEIR